MKLYPDMDGWADLEDLFEELDQLQAGPEAYLAVWIMGAGMAALLGFVLGCVIGG